jgi:DNA-binding transcriptional MerR regulator
VRIDIVRSGSYVWSGMHADLSSGDLARASGHTVRAIRFYEEEGLLKPAVVSEGGHRRYTQDDLERLQLICDLRELGLSIGEIRSVLEIRTGCHTASEFVLRFQQVLAGHLEQAQRRLERLRRVKRELLDALAALAEGVPAAEDRCPCAVAEAEHAPRIVRVLARQAGCCGHARDDGPSDEDDVGLATAPPVSLARDAGVGAGEDAAVRGADASRERSRS